MHCRSSHVRAEFRKLTGDVLIRRARTDLRRKFYGKRRLIRAAAAERRHSFSFVGLLLSLSLSLSVSLSQLVRSVMLSVRASEVEQLYKSSSDLNDNDGGDCQTTSSTPR